MAISPRRTNPQGRMPLGGHLREFRRRVLIAVLAVGVAAVYGWIKFQTVYDWMVAPLFQAAARNGFPAGSVSTNFANGVSDSFSIKLKIAIWLGFIIASPVWLWQIWGFLAPGLTRKEKRIGSAFILTAVPLFLTGCWVATRTMPNAIDFLIGQTPTGGTNFIAAQAYIGFVTKFILAFGLAFLLPVFLVGLNTIHVLPARMMIKGWRVATMLIFVFAAVMSPSPDAWSMLALAFPMVILYFIAVGISAILDRRRHQAQPHPWLEVPDTHASTL